MPFYFILTNTEQSVGQLLFFCRYPRACPFAVILGLVPGIQPKYVVTRSVTPSRQSRLREAACAAEMTRANNALEFNDWIPAYLFVAMLCCASSLGHLPT